jgi:ubiquinone/menaquinone biosynthesis C-methylase UbiE
MAALVDAERKVSGVDMDSNLLNLAKARMQSDANKGSSAICDWHLEDAYEINRVFRGNMAADALVIANKFHGVPVKNALSLVVAKVLKPWGSFIIINRHAMAREETVVLGNPHGPKTQLRMRPKDVEAVVILAGFPRKK